MMTETQATLPNPDMPTTIPDLCIDLPKKDVEMTYLEKKNIDEAINKNIRKKDVYELDMHKI